MAQVGLTKQMMMVLVLDSRVELEPSMEKPAPRGSTAGAVAVAKKSVSVIDHELHTEVKIAPAPQNDDRDLEIEGGRLRDDRANWIVFCA